MENNLNKNRTFIGKRRYGLITVYLMVLITIGYIYFFRNPFPESYLAFLGFITVLVAVILSASEKIAGTIELNISQDLVQIKFWKFSKYEPMIQNKIIKIDSIVAIEELDNKNILALELNDIVFQLQCQQLQEFISNGLVNVNISVIEKAIRNFRNCGDKIDRRKINFLERHIV